MSESAFVNEVKQVLSSKSAEENPDNARETKVIQGTEALDILPTGTEPVDEKAPIVKVEDPDTDPPPKPIKIAGKEFSSIDEAMAYAEQLALAQIEEQAFAEGVKAAQKQQEPEQPKKTYVEEAEEKLFEDPKAAIEILRKGIQDEIWAAYNKLVAEQQAQIRQQQQREATWNAFYEQNPDLAESRDYVEYLLQKNWDTLKDKPANKALEELAELARKQLRIAREASLPKQELQTKPVTLASGTGAATTPQASATTEKLLDFVAQVNMLRRRK